MLGLAWAWAWTWAWTWAWAWEAGGQVRSPAQGSDDAELPRGCPRTHSEPWQAQDRASNNSWLF